MTLKPWDEFAPEPIQIPVGGKVYTLPPMAFKTGLQIQAAIKDPEPGMTNMDLWRLCLGPVFDEMVEGEAPAAAIERAGMVAYTDWRSGRDAAEAIWETGVSPEALAAAATAANKGTKKTTGRKKGSTRSTGTGAARKTPSRASTSGTRTSRTR
jgi:ParB-like chromosome segregation protein Spo0J